MSDIEITRDELTAGELRAASGKTKGVLASRRMLVLVLDGGHRTTAAQSCGMDRQTLRDCVHRCNAAGLAGLSNRKALGRSRSLKPEQRIQLARLVKEGPDPKSDDVLRWRRVDPRRGVVLHGRTVGKYLAELGFVRISVQPQYLKVNPDAQEAFKKTSRAG